MGKDYIAEYNRLRKILSPEDYRASRERVEILSAMVKDGERAKTIKDFVDAMVESVGKEVLVGLENPSNDAKELQYVYRGAVLFKNKVYNCISIADIKRAKIDEIKHEQKKE